MDASQRLAEMAARLRVVSEHFSAKQSVPWTELLGVLRDQLVQMSASLDYLARHPSSGSLEIRAGSKGPDNVCHRTSREAFEYAEEIASIPTDAELLQEIGLILNELGDLVRDCSLPPPEPPSPPPPFRGLGRG